MLAFGGSEWPQDVTHPKAIASSARSNALSLLSIAKWPPSQEAPQRSHGAQVLTDLSIRTR
jgi:hypothetical protein